MARYDRILASAILLISTPVIAQSYHEVRGYTRSDGTYVAPHYQTNADSTKLDNWSTRGNVDPLTGQAGTVDTYRSTPSNPSGSPYDQGNGGWPR